jgi:hypothetical protein
MLEGIGKMKKFKDTIDQARRATVYIYAHHRTLALMRKFTNRRDIVRPGVTTFASNFLTLQSLYEKKDKIRAMSQCEEWQKFSNNKKNPKGVQVTGSFTKPNFWSSIALCLRVFSPLFKVLHMVDGDVKLLTVKIRQPSHEFTFGVGISFIPYPLVLTPVV